MTLFFHSDLVFLNFKFFAKRLSLEEQQMRLIVSSNEFERVPRLFLALYVVCACRVVAELQRWGVAVDGEQASIRSTGDSGVRLSIVLRGKSAFSACSSLFYEFSVPGNGSYTYPELSLCTKQVSYSVFSETTGFHEPSGDPRSALATLGTLQTRTPSGS